MRRTVLKTLAAVSLGLAFSASAWASRLRGQTLHFALSST